MPQAAWQIDSRVDGISILWANGADPLNGDACGDFHGAVNAANHTLTLSGAGFDAYAGLNVKLRLSRLAGARRGSWAATIDASGAFSWGYPRLRQGATYAVDYSIEGWSHGCPPNSANVWRVWLTNVGADAAIEVNMADDVTDALCTDPL